MENVRGGLIKRLDTESVLARLAEIVEVEEQDRQEHQHGTEQGVQEEFDGCIELARAAPDADQQVHRHEHGFPEDEEQEEIQRHENA